MAKAGNWSDLQADWESPLHSDAWGNGRDNHFVLNRLWNLPADVVQRAVPGRVLDVAAAGAVHSTAIAARGFSCVALEPSPTMLAAARARIAETATDVRLVQGFAEALPFRDASFDQVLCHSAIDHFAEPDRCIREMVRVLRPTGRLILTYVNYGGLSTRLSRVFYKVDSLFRRHPRSPHWFWESPVPDEHSFECTVPVVGAMCEQYLDLDEMFGISLGWQMPGWGWALSQLSHERATRILTRLDAIAAGAPALADIVVAVWRPRPRATWRISTPRGAANGAAAAAAEALRVTGADPVYRRLIAEEARPKQSLSDGTAFARLLAAYARMCNRQITGDAGRTWIDDFIDRCRPGRAAVLGVEGDVHLARWQRAKVAQVTDVFDLSPHVLARTRAAMAAQGVEAGLRWQEADLNFLELPARQYANIWSSGCLHHVVNLEHLFAQIELGLAEDGLFAVNDYVGEPRRRFAADRLALVNALLADIPARFRIGAAPIEPPFLPHLGPFCSARSAEIPGLLRQCFTPVHEVETGHLFPLELCVDLERIEAEEPALLEPLLNAQRRARESGAYRACMLYGVYRRRS